MPSRIELLCMVLQTIGQRFVQTDCKGRHFFFKSKQLPDLISVTIIIYFKTHVRLLYKTCAKDIHPAIPHTEGDL